jgi:integrase
LAVLWLDDQAFKKLAPSTQAVQRRILDRIRKEHGHRIVRHATALDVRKLIAARQDTPAAANHVLRLLRSLFGFAVKLEWRADNPAKTVERLEEKQEGHPDWPDAIIALYRAHHPIGTKPRLAFELILQTAQRKSDALRLGRQHLGQGGTILQFRQKKTGTELVLPVTDELQACITHLPEKQLTFLLTEAGAPFTENGFYNVFRDWCDQAGVPRGYSAHGLRKARARLLAEAGATAHEIMAWTGHKSLAEVERYTRAASLARMARSGMAKEKARTAIG